jgi:hypothetical protein
MIQIQHPGQFEKAGARGLPIYPPEIEARREVYATVGARLRDLEHLDANRRPGQARPPRLRADPSGAARPKGVPEVEAVHSFRLALRRLNRADSDRPAKVLPFRKGQRGAER